MRHLIAVGDSAIAEAVPYGTALEGSSERDFGPRDGADLYIIYTGGTDRPAQRR